MLFFPVFRMFLAYVLSFGWGASFIIVDRHIRGWFVIGILSFLVLFKFGRFDQVRVVHLMIIQDRVWLPEKA